MPWTCLPDCAPFTSDGPPFNFCRLLAGSEGTLAFLTEITLACEPLPPPESALVCVHCATIDEALRANHCGATVFTACLRVDGPPYP